MVGYELRVSVCECTFIILHTRVASIFERLLKLRLCTVLQRAAVKSKRRWVLKRRPQIVLTTRAEIASLSHQAYNAWYLTVEANLFKI